MNAEYIGASVDSLTPVSNLVHMNELSEAAILHNLRLRYEVNLIYTSIAAILVSINPFKMLPIYSPAIMREYRDKINKQEEVSPHVYALADQCYKALAADRSNQCVIISGESGAGKTEAAKLVMQYLSEMSGQGSAVEQQLLESNQCIEAMGNAKTVRNNNSSRFGKWIQIQFNERLHIVGANMSQYLLEKSRIVALNPGERNYHVYYQLCAGASAAERARLQLEDAAAYKILRQGASLDIDGLDDADEWRRTRGALEVLKFSTKEIEDISSVLAACLHLGNVEFIEQGDGSQCTNTNVVNIAAGLLAVDVQVLLAVLVSHRKQMGKESILTVRTPLQAEHSRDALLKKLYSQMFAWLIAHINKTLSPPSQGKISIAVLDLFGFENFTTNRYEQYLINYANGTISSTL